MRMRSNPSPIGRLVTALVIAGSAWAVGTNLIVDQLIKACTIYSGNDSCFYSVPVPCNNATCVDVGSYEDQGGIPGCTNKPGGPGYASKYDETVTALAWYRCGYKPSTGAPCGEGLVQCSTVVFYEQWLHAVMLA